MVPRVLQRISPIPRGEARGDNALDPDSESHCVPTNLLMYRWYT